MSTSQDSIPSPFMYRQVFIFCVDNVLYGWYDNYYFTRKNIVSVLNESSNDDINKIKALVKAVVQNCRIVNESELQAINETVNTYLNWPTDLGREIFEFGDRDFSVPGIESPFIAHLVNIYKENSVWTDNGFNNVSKYGSQPIMYKGNIPIATFIEGASYCDFDKQVL